MGEFVVLSEKGDERIEWDPADKESVKKAYAEYERLKKDGYDFFAVEETAGRRITRFDKKLGRVIAAPGAASKKDRETGSRPKAMRGGPTLREE